MNPTLLGRTTRLLIGLFAFAVSVSLMIRSELGLGPWDTFHVGLSSLTGLSVGLIMILVGVVLVVVSYFIRVRAGPGTIANMILIGAFTDLLLPMTPTAAGVILPWVYYLVGVGVAGLATGFYISAGLGTGPRDSLMVGLAALTRWPIRRVRTLIEASALGVGWVLGGTVGIGTVVFLVLIGPVTQWGMELFPIPGAQPKGPDVRRSRTARRDAAA